MDTTNNIKNQSEYPAIVRWMYTSPQDDANQNNLCHKITATVLVLIESLGMFIASIPVFPFVFDEFCDEWDRINHFFVDKKVTVIPTTTTPDTPVEPLPTQVEPNPLVPKKPKRNRKLGKKPENRPPQLQQNGSDPVNIPRTNSRQPNPTPTPPLILSITPPEKPLPPAPLNGATATADKVNGLAQAQQKPAFDQIDPNALKWAISEERAVQLHVNNFRKDFIFETSQNHSVPYISKGVCYASIFQFQNAVKIAKKEFEELMISATTPELERQFSKLIMIILVGRQAKESKGPIKTCCFQFRELTGQSVKHTDGESIPLMDLVLMDTPSENLSPALLKVCTLNQETAKSLRSFIDSLALTDEDVQRMVMTKPAKDFIENIQDKLFDTLKTVKNQSTDEMQQHYEYLIDHFNKITDQDKAISFKIFELLVLQSSIGVKEAQQLSQDILMKYPGELPEQKITGVEFQKDKDVVITTLKSEISFNPDAFLNEAIPEFNNKNIVVAEFLSEESLNDDVIRPVKSLSSLKVSWKIPENFLNFLAVKINPNNLENTPQELFKAVSKNIDEATAGLSKMAADLNPTLYGWMKSFVANTQQENVSVITIKNYLTSSFKTYCDYIKLANLNPQASKEVASKNDAFRASLEGLRDHLVKRLKDSNIQKTNDEVAHLTILIADLEEKLRVIPVSTKDDPTFFSTFITTFIADSTDPKHFSWKIDRYEAQFEGLFNSFRNHFGELSESTPDMNASTYLTMSWVDNVSDRSVAVTILYKQLVNVKAKIDQLSAPGKNHYTQTHLKSLRDSYKTFLKTFDKFYAHALSKKAKNPERLEALNKIGHIIYTSVNLRKEMRKTLETFDEQGAIALGQEPTIPVDQSLDDDKKMHPYVLRIKSLHHRIENAPRAAKTTITAQTENSLRGHFNRGFNPNMDSNPTHTQYTLKVVENGKERMIESIAMGTPTNEDSHSNVSLVPEFVACMSHYKKEEKRHLMVNFQNIIPPSENWSSPLHDLYNYFMNDSEANPMNNRNLLSPHDWLEYFKGSNESPRCFELMNSQRKVDLEGALYAITLSKDSDFYHQKGEHHKIDNTNDFIKNLEEYTLNSNLQNAQKYGSYISKEVFDLYCKKYGGNLDRSADHLAKQIQCKFFGGKESLNVLERKLFIELFYTQLVNIILVRCEFHSFNESCKDKIDRGAAHEAMHYAAIALNNVDLSKTNINHPLKDDDKEMVEELLHSRALFVRKRPILKKRFERACEVYQFQLDRVKELQKLHKAILPDIQIVPV